MNSPKEKNQCIQCEQYKKELQEKEDKIKILENNILKIKSLLSESGSLIDGYNEIMEENKNLKLEIEKLKNDINIYNNNNYQFEILKQKIIRYQQENQELKATKQFYESQKTPNIKNKDSNETKIKRELCQKDKEINQLNTIISLLKSHNNDEHLSNEDIIKKYSKSKVNNNNINNINNNIIHNNSIVDEDDTLFFENDNNNNNNIYNHEMDFPNKNFVNINNVKMIDLYKEKEFLSDEYQKYKQKYIIYKFKYHEFKKTTKLFLNYLKIIPPGNNISNIFESINDKKTLNLIGTKRLKSNNEKDEKKTSDYLYNNINAIRNININNQKRKKSEDTFKDNFKIPSLFNNTFNDNEDYYNGDIKIVETEEENNTNSKKNKKKVEKKKNERKKSEKKKRGRKKNIEIKELDEEESAIDKSNKSDVSKSDEEKDKKKKKEKDNKIKSEPKKRGRKPKKEKDKKFKNNGEEKVIIDSEDEDEDEDENEDKIKDKDKANNDKNKKNEENIEKGLNDEDNKEGKEEKNKNNEEKENNNSKEKENKIKEGHIGPIPRNIKKKIDPTVQKTLNINNLLNLLSNNPEKITEENLNSILCLQNTINEKVSFIFEIIMPNLIRIELSRVLSLFEILLDLNEDSKTIIGVNILENIHMNLNTNSLLSKKIHLKIANKTNETYKNYINKNYSLAIYLISFLIDILYRKLVDISCIDNFIFQLIFDKNIDDKNKNNILLILINTIKEENQDNNNKVFFKEDQLKKYLSPENENKFYFFISYKNILISQKIVNLILSIYDKNKINNIDNEIINHFNNIFNCIPEDKELKIEIPNLTEEYKSPIKFNTDLFYLEIFQALSIIVEIKEMKWIIENIFVNILWKAFINSNKDSLKRALSIYYSSLLFYLCLKNGLKNNTNDNLLQQKEFSTLYAWLYGLYKTQQQNENIIGFYEKICALSWIIESPIMNMSTRVYDTVKESVNDYIKNEKEKLCPLDFLDKLRKLKLLEK